MCPDLAESAGTFVIPKVPGQTTDDYRSLFLSDTPLLDVRAPVEFVKGAFPSSTNLPLINDAERHKVGIQYKGYGQQSAIELAARLIDTVSRKARITAWKHFVDANPDCVLYCFRGGLRSRITQAWLTEAGCDIPLVTGGYKALRNYLIESLKLSCSRMRFTLIGGRTGSGKTSLIKQLGRTVDLEGLANHRGSSFGGMDTPQPSNVDFENAVAIALLKLEAVGEGPVYLEDEARLIGRVCLPDSLRESMQLAPIAIVDCDMDQRVKNCFDDYVTDLLNRYTVRLGNAEGFETFSQHHRESLSRIQKRFGLVNYKFALQLLEEALARHRSTGETDRYIPFIQMLLLKYYDPMYDYQLKIKQHRIVFTGKAADIIQRLKHT